MIKNKLFKLMIPVLLLMVSMTGCHDFWGCLGADMTGAFIDGLLFDDPYYYGSSCYYEDTVYVTEEVVTTTEDEPVKTVDVVMTEEGATIFPNELEQFDAVYNPTTDRYEFAPDPFGDITGASVDCEAVIDDFYFRGDCYSDGYSCSFAYQRESVNHPEVFVLLRTTCEESIGVGPFYVP